MKMGCAYHVTLRGMKGLPETGILANKSLKENLLNYGSSEVDHIPGIFKHTVWPVWVTLVMDILELSILANNRCPETPLKDRRILDLRALLWNHIAAGLCTLVSFSTTGSYVNI
jgi:hypothetical protein